MLNQIKPLKQLSFGQCTAWPYRCAQAGGDDDKHAELRTALLQAAAIAPLPGSLVQRLGDGRQRLRDGFKGGGEDATSLTRLETWTELASPASSFVWLSLPPTAESTSSASSSASLLAGRADHTSASPSRAYSPAASSKQSSLRTLSQDPRAPPALPPRRSLKRRRSLTDVDGPDTAALGIKKRRLRRDLITSRLSQPFSLPATHILNREAVAFGDKSFLKRAAIMAVRRLNHFLPTPASTQLGPSSSLHRIAVVNRIRLRLHAEVTQRGDSRLTHIAANIALVQHRHGLGGFVAATRFPALAIAVRMPLIAGRGSAAAAGTGPVAGSGPATVTFTALSRRPPLDSVPSPLQLPPTETQVAPVIRSIAEGMVVETIVVGGGAEDYMEEDRAFPTSELESRYETSDDPDDVYTDFNAIFGGGGLETDLSDSDGEMEHVEDYMDDLDGIPWMAR